MGATERTDWPIVLGLLDLDKGGPSLGPALLHDIAEAIPDGTRIVDIGAESEVLRKLTQGRCEYIGGGPVAGPGVIEWDCTSGWPPAELRGHDLVVFDGVTERLADPASAIRALTACAPWGFFTYAVAEKRSAERPGVWVNAFSEQEFRDLLEHAGWTPVASGDRRGHIIVEARKA